MATAGGDGDQEENGPLVFQRGKKLNDEYYIVSVRDNSENACIKFAAYELETSEVFELAYTYTDFDILFKAHPELVNPANKDGRYEWVVDRLDFVTDSSGSAKRLTLASEPTLEDDGVDPKAGPAAKPIPKDRLTFAERTRLRAEAEKLEEKRAANIALKSEKNRKAFVAELLEKRKLEELKAATRSQRIDEERAERRERAEMQKRSAEERQKRYEENEKKREERIRMLEAERKTRDLAAIREIIGQARETKERLQAKLEDARNRKLDEEKRYAAEMAAKREEQDALNAKRDAKIRERNERLKQAEREYLEFRTRQIENISNEKQLKEERKQAYIRERAAKRAAQLRAKHEKAEAWERLDDQRTQNNLNKEHARNMLMLDHIESLRLKYREEQAEAAARKTASLEERREREARETEELAEENRKKSELEQRRNRNIATREAMREQKNQHYCDHIRDLKTTESLRIKEQQSMVASARDKTREERTRERQMRAEQELAAATVNAQREENIRRKERERDIKFAAKEKEKKEAESKRVVEMEARKIQKRLREKEAAIKRQEEDQLKRRQMAMLEEQREQMIRERAQERNKREQDRLKPGEGTASATDEQA
eukprot:TRINITY_DN41935_c0_g1_i1.p1 TRINITY_DN41935_c0_g1~~TRINITY_DN41935_c0_g1_i1.p1  ORF type:complete len:606 (+),score=193.47 TRINITY_DN41935_c0_g1_i1:94-1911(+)